MADLGERLEGKGWLLGAVVLAPVLVPALARGLRPVAKEAIKGYLALQERCREWCAETGEQWQDLVAEARAEHASDAEALAVDGRESPEGAGRAPASA